VLIWYAKQGRNNPFSGFPRVVVKTSPRLTAFALPNQQGEIKAMLLLPQSKYPPRKPVSFDFAPDWTLITAAQFPSLEKYIDSRPRWWKVIAARQSIRANEPPLTPEWPRPRTDALLSESDYALRWIKNGDGEKMLLFFYRNRSMCIYDSSWGMPSEQFFAIYKERFDAIFALAGDSVQLRQLHEKLRPLQLFDCRPEAPSRLFGPHAGEKKTLIKKDTGNAFSFELHPDPKGALRYRESFEPF
jgi:hypothetical protein